MKPANNKRTQPKLIISQSDIKKFMTDLARAIPNQLEEDQKNIRVMIQEECSLELVVWFYMTLSEKKKSKFISIMSNIEVKGSDNLWDEFLDFLDQFGSITPTITQNSSPRLPQILAEKFSILVTRLLSFLPEKR